MSAAKIRDALRKLTKDPREVQAMPATVDSVDEDAGTCDVTPLDGGAQVFDVWLAAFAKTDRVMTVPVVGSVVLIDFYDDAHAYVASFGESRAWKARHGSHQLEHDGEGLLVANGNDSLAKAIDELMALNASLLDALNTLIVLTPAGPSTGLGPNSVVAIAQLKGKSNLLKNTFQRLLKSN